MPALPSSVSVTPSNLVSSANFINMHSITSFKSLLNRTGLRRHPSGAPLVTDLLLGYDPLITTLWAWPSKHFLMHLFAHPCRPWSPNLGTTTLWRTMLKGLAKVTSSPLPSSTNPVILSWKSRRSVRYDLSVWYCLFSKRKASQHAYHQRLHTFSQSCTFTITEFKICNY